MTVHFLARARGHFDGIIRIDEILRYIHNVKSRTFGQLSSPKPNRLVAQRAL